MLAASEKTMVASSRAGLRIGRSIKLSLQSGVGSEDLIPIVRRPFSFVEPETAEAAPPNRLAFAIERRRVLVLCDFPLNNRISSGPQELLNIADISENTNHSCRWNNK